MESDIEILKREIETATDPKYLKRLNAVLSKIQGSPVEDVNAESLRRWLNAFMSHGLDALKDKDRTGRPNKLTIIDRENLQKDLL